jgi:predicted DNA-binding transcriptional regulator YafY
MVKLVADKLQMVVAPGMNIRTVRITYKNWRGVTLDRDIIPNSIFFGTTEWHPEQQWFLVAFDKDKKEVRYFAMKDISNWVNAGR